MSEEAWRGLGDVSWSDGSGSDTADEPLSVDGLGEMSDADDTHMSTDHGEDFLERLWLDQERAVRAIVHEQAFQLLPPERKIKVLQAAGEILVLALDKSVSNVTAIDDVVAVDGEKELAIARPCFNAFYSCRKNGEYPLGSDGKAGVHDDLLTLFKCMSYSWCMPVHDALLAQQFMTHHTRKITQLRQDITSIGNTKVSEHRRVAVCMMAELPVVSQRLLKKWRTTFLEKHETGDGDQV